MAPILNFERCPAGHTRSSLSTLIGWNSLRFFAAIFFLLHGDLFEPLFCALFHLGEKQRQVAISPWQKRQRLLTRIHFDTSLIRQRIHPSKTRPKKGGKKIVARGSSTCSGRTCVNLVPRIPACCIFSTIALQLTMFMNPNEISE